MHGEITKTDLEIGRLLLALEKDYPSLQEVNFHKSVEAGIVLAIVVGRGDANKLLTSGGKIVRAIGEKTGKSIRVIENGVDDRKFLEDLFAPLSIITINIIWLPDGSQETRVILRKRGRKPIPIYIDGLKQIAQKVRRMTLRVEFAS
jgi:transcription antitermination factor NusA-like protein